MPPADPADARTILEPGTAVDHFKILRLLGRGGMGEVYLARDTKLGRRVALKRVLSKDVRAEQTRRRFMEEARATARFSHPHIVTVYHVGEHQGSPYLALEYVEGQTLRERWREERPSAMEVARVALAIAEALREAHAAQLIHQDLKPENILIARDGRLKILDFGLASEVHPSLPAQQDDPGPVITSEATRSVLRGSPAYMSPEQWRDLERDEKVDVWALGVILYELVVGQRPYEGLPVRQLGIKVASATPLPLGDTLANTPSHLASLIESCLDKEPEKRPSAEELVEALEELLHRQPRRLGEGESPFRGLLPFAERHAELFFGRESEVAAFVERVRHRPVLPVVGPSGAGKSSFVWAGVVPRLREQSHWVVLSMRPGARPFHNLASRLVAGESTVPPTSSQQASVLTDSSLTSIDGESQPSARGQQREALSRQLFEQPHLLALHLLQIAERSGARVLLVIDQLHEIYTQLEDVEQRRRFMEAVSLAADDAQDPVRVIFTLRDDFLGRAAEGSAAREVLEHVTVIRRPGKRALAQILQRPLDALGYRYDDASLIGTMIDDVQGHAASLPLLQFATRMLWERRDVERKLLLRSAYEAIGGVAGALAEHADTVLSGMSGEQIQLARQLLLRLVTAEGMRRALAWGRLVRGLPQGANTVLRQLVDSRLVVVRRGRGEEQMAAEVELVHESLVRSWRRLALWINSSREELAFLSEVQQAAELWQRRGQRDSEVWLGDALRDAQRVLGRVVSIPPLVSEFLQAGQLKESKARRRRTLQRTLIMTTLVLAALFSAITAGVISRKEQAARREHGRAEEQRQEALSKRSEAQRTGARAALLRRDPLLARAYLRSSLEVADAPLARMLWHHLEHEALKWQRRLGTNIYALAFYPDGKTLAVASQDRSIYLFDVRNRDVRFLRGHHDQVLSLATSSDGRFLASADWGGMVRLWSTRDTSSRVLRGHDSAVSGLAFAPGGELLATGSQDGTLRLWRTASGKALASIKLDGATKEPLKIGHIAFSPDGRRIVASCRDGSARLIDVATRKEFKALRGHRGDVQAVDYSADGEWIATGGIDRTIRLWRSTGELVRVLHHHRANVLNVTFSADSKKLASGGRDATICLWDVESGSLMRSLHDEGAVHGLAFSPNGRLLATGGYSKMLRIWQLEAAPLDRPSRGHRGMVTGIAFSPDGKRLFSGGYDKTLRSWDVETGRATSTIEIKAPIFDIAFSPSGEQLATSHSDGLLRLRETSTGRPLATLRGHTGEATMLAYSPDGRWLVSGSRDSTARIWDVKERRPHQLLKGHDLAIFAAAYSPDGKLVATAGLDRTLRLWSPRTGRLRRILRGHPGPIYGVAFGAGGKTLYAAGAREVWRWTIKNAQGARLLGEKGRRYYLLDAWGDRWAIPASDGTILLSGAEGGAERILRGHRGEVNVARFDSIGDKLASSGDDGTLRLWDTRGGRPLWFASALLPSPPRLYSHRGWRRLDGHEKLGPLRAWERAIAARGRHAELDRTRGLLCLFTHQGVLELWATREDRRLQSHQLRELRELRALEGGCVVLVGDQREALLLSPAKGRRSLARDVSALATTTDAIWLAQKDQLLRFDKEGRALGREAGQIGTSTIAVLQHAIALGNQDGNIQLQPRDKATTETKTVFEETPSSAVTRLIAGPPGTLVAGYANGQVGLWSRKNGARLDEAGLHGPISQLLHAQGKVYAITTLGDHLEFDTSVFDQPYCELMRRVWRAVPVVKEGGRLTLHPPPREHRCWREGR